jgi:hypothetical protein
MDEDGSWMKMGSPMNMGFADEDGVVEDGVVDDGVVDDG